MVGVPAPATTVVRTGSSSAVPAEEAAVTYGGPPDVAAAVAVVNGATAGGEGDVPVGGAAADGAEPPAVGGDAGGGMPAVADGAATVAATVSDMTATSVGSGGDGASPVVSPAKIPHAEEGGGVPGTDGAAIGAAAAAGGVDAAASKGGEAEMARNLSLVSEPHGSASPPTPLATAAAGTSSAATGGGTDDGVDESLLRALSSGGVLSAAAAWDAPAVSANAAAPPVSRQGSTPKYEVSVPGLKLAHAIPTEAETSDGGDGPGGPSTPVSPRYVERRPSMPPLMALGGGRRDSSAVTDGVASARGGGEADGDPDEDLSRLRHTPSTVKRLAGEYELRDQFAAEEREYIEATWRSLKEGPRTEAAEAVAADIAAAVAAANEEEGSAASGSAGGDPVIEKEPSFAMKAAIVAVASGAKLSPT